MKRWKHERAKAKMDRKLDSVYRELADVRQELDKLKERTEPKCGFNTVTVDKIREQAAR